MLTLRNIEMADAVHLMRLDLKGYDNPWEPDRWRQLGQNADENAICITETNRQPVAFAAYSTEGQQIKILRMTVAPSYRRKKLATRMVKWLSDMGLDRGFRRITCLVAADNLDACSFLSKVEFAVPAKGGIMADAFENCGYKVDGYYFIKDLRK